MIQYGVPGFMRSDNRPEFIAAKVQQWLADHQTKAIYIDPGSPRKNGYIASFHSRLRGESLRREMLLNRREAQVAIADGRQHYNRENPIVDSVISAQRTLYKPEHSHPNRANY
ncbi:MAG: transposase [Gemmatimonadetes bacterium]|jgi:transposase InsO family protein|nr:transposase [Gemmatimonadota bacterium]MBT5326255.1 transposase [Gemmatimonadota bacterium]MBT5452742.1 transposase [Gemmatimonadota bacterium]MBT5800365.1 transposase [Gemmatimonadota bacterium]MBT6619522.1 transposase [Gemmatimonadota bacterium]